MLLLLEEARSSPYLLDEAVMKEEVHASHGSAPSSWQMRARSRRVVFEELV